MDSQAVPAEIPDSGSFLTNGSMKTAISSPGTDLTVTKQSDGSLSINNGTMTFLLPGEATKASEVDYVWAPRVDESIVSVATDLQELLSEVGNAGGQHVMEKDIEKAAELFEMMKARIQFGERMLSAIAKGSQETGNRTGEHAQLKAIALEAAQLKDLGGPLDVGPDEIDAFVRIAQVCEPPQTLELIEWKSLISLYTSMGANRSRLRKTAVYDRSM